MELRTELALAPLRWEGVEDHSKDRSKDRSKDWRPRGGLKFDRTEDTYDGGFVAPHDDSGGVFCGPS